MCNNNPYGTKKYMHNLPELRFKGFKPKTCEYNLLSVYNKISQGLASSWQYQCNLKSDLAKTHVLTSKGLESTNNQSSHIVSSDLDPVEHRYILVGKTTGGLAIYDSSKAKNDLFQRIAVKRGGSKGTHKYGARCVQWYPLDAGLFMTSSCDRSIKIWDPNSMQKVDEFSMTCDIAHHNMSQVASSHSLVAAAGETGEVILCDLKTGSSTHRLHGHEGPAQVVQWSKHDQNVLASGGKDKTVRLWDVRSGRACLSVLNDCEVSSCKEKRFRRSPLAHSTPITSLCFSYDGLWLVSCSSDGYLKVWDAVTYKKLDLSFGLRYTSYKKVFPISITHNLYPDLIFVPSLSKIFVYEVATGALINVLSGHLSLVYGTVLNPVSGDLYSYGADQNFLVWTPESLIPRELEEEEEKKGKQVTLDQWSSDED